jgi:hypothetical protein
VEQQNQITTSKDKTRIKPESVTQIAIDAIYVGEIEVFPSESLHLRGGRNDW